MRRRLIAAFVAASLVMVALPAHGEDLWALIRAAQAYQDAGQYAQAIPLWEKLAPAFANQGDAANAALFYKRLGWAYQAVERRSDAVAAYESEATFWTQDGHADWGKEDLIRADQLRTVLKLYVQRPATLPTRPLAKFEPAAGAILGGYIFEDRSLQNSLVQANRTFGKKLGGVLLYWRYKVDTVQGKRLYLDQARQNGAAVQIALEPTQGLNSVQDDAALHALARDLAAAGVPVFLRFASEMNGEWVNWHGNPALYRQKFQLVAQVMHQETTNVAMVWSPNDLPEGTIADYYPGDDAVDWVGVSSYTDYYSAGQVDRSNLHVSPVDALRYLDATYGARKPIMISETAVSTRQYVDGRPITDWAVASIQKLYGGLPRLYPNVKAIFWWDKNKYADDGDPTKFNYLLTENAQVLAAFRAAIADPYYLSTVDGQGAAMQYREITRLEPQTETLSAYVKLYEPVVSKVEYAVNGRAIGTALTAPWTVTHDFAPYDGQTVELTVRVYDATGHLDSARTRPVPVGLKDVPGHWAQGAIRDLIRRGAVAGYADGTFRPDDRISREAFYTLLARALALPAGAGDSPFTDLAPDRWSYPYAKALVAAGMLVVADYPGAALTPTADLPRQEMAALAARAAKLQALGSAGFPDAGLIRPQWQGLVAAAAGAKLVSGFPDGSFGANGPATRAQAAVVIAKALTLLGK